MGLFDNFQFDPQSFGGTEGLLSMLTRFQQQGGANEPSPLDSAQWPAGPIGNYGQTQNVAVGDYQMPQFGTAPQPDPAAIPQNAQAVQYMPPQQQQAPQQESPGLGDRLSAGLSGFGAGGRSGGLIGALTGGASALASGVAPENQTVKALVARGLDPATAQTVARDPALLRSVIPQLMGTAGQTDDIKEYQFAKREDPTLTFDKFMQKKKSVSGEYSLTPQYGTNDKGETVLIQTGKSGEAIQTKLPAGVKVSSGVEKIDLGTSWGLVDKRTGQLVGQQAKDVAGKASQEAQGEAQGKAIVALPTVINTTQQSIKLVDEMINHPGRETATGLSGTIDPRNYLGGTDAKDFQVRSKQVEGRTFLSAFDQLRGAGAITEAEGAKATAAMARLDRAQSDEEYLKSLIELKGILNKGMEIARQRAGQGGQPVAGAATTAPSAGPSVDDLLKKYGG